MITIKHPFDFPDTYPLDRIGPLKDILFFDIETTGFSVQDLGSLGGIILDRS